MAKIATTSLIAAFAITLTLAAQSSLADSGQDGIGTGATINQQNWRQYRQFMSEGLAALFEGTLFWHLAADSRIAVGPTTLIPPPKQSLVDTTKYSSRVRLSSGPRTADTFLVDTSQAFLFLIRRQEILALEDSALFGMRTIATSLEGGWTAKKRSAN